MAETRKLCPVHFVGQVSLETVENVLRTISSALGERTLRLPDGEVGSKQGWINTQHRVFERHPDFESVEAEPDWRTPNRRRRHFRLKPGVSMPDAAKFGPLGYAEWARESYEVFSRLKSEGTLPGAARLKIAIPSPYDNLNYAIEHHDFPKVRAVYETLLFAEVAEIARSIPHRDLAIQWDVAHEFEALASNAAVFYPITHDEVVELLIRIGRTVPQDIELGYHCCYGNYNLRHFIEPEDTGDMVRVMNGIAAGLGRPIQFIHMPVPLARSDDAYFAPLREFRPHPETELFLGLVHDRDGREGSLKRAAAAHRALAWFGIATECGLGQRTPENVRDLLRIQAETAAALDVV